MADHIPILHTDDRIVAVNKPAGVTVVPAPDVPAEGCLRAHVERHIDARLWVVHRLDRDTSGVVVFARSADAHRDLCLAFEDRRVQKTYLALTAGVPDPREGRVEIPLHAARRGKTRPARPDEPGGQAAATGYIVRTHWELDGGRVALVEAHPETGRHHQIRVHLRAIGCPILFDGTYGRGIDMGTLDGAPCPRMALHASRIVVPQPDGTRLAIDAPLPADLTALLTWLDGERTTPTTPRCAPTS
jgi:RluA family pseudouridine synthase